MKDEIKKGVPGSAETPKKGGEHIGGSYQKEGNLRREGNQSQEDRRKGAFQKEGFNKQGRESNLTEADRSKGGKKGENK